MSRHNPYGANIINFSVMNKILRCAQDDDEATCVILSEAKNLSDSA